MSTYKSSQTNTLEVCIIQGHSNINIIAHERLQPSHWQRKWLVEIPGRLISQPRPSTVKFTLGECVLPQTLGRCLDGIDLWKGDAIK